MACFLSRFISYFNIYVFFLYSQFFICRLAGVEWTRHQKHFSVFYIVMLCHFIMHLVSEVSELMLCFLLVACVSYDSANSRINICHIFITGEMISIPLLNSVASIWPLPFGLLLQKSTYGNYQNRITFNSSISLPHSRDLPRNHREHGPNRYVPTIHNLHDLSTKELKEYFPMESSHLILKHSLEEPQVLFFPNQLHLFLIINLLLINFYSRVFIVNLS